MELKDIVSIAGIGGLHKIVGRAKNGLILETLGSGKRFASAYQDRVSVLEDVSMFTTGDDMKLSEVFLKLQTATNFPENASDLKIWRQFLVDTINLDSERVYDSDIKKLLNWYNVLKDIVDFSKVESAEDVSEAETGETAIEETPTEE